MVEFHGGVIQNASSVTNMWLYKKQLDKLYLKIGGSIGFLSVLSLCLLGCNNDTSQKANVEETNTTSILFHRGSEIVHGNCAGCHSYKNDTAYAKSGIYTMYEMDSLKLSNSLKRVLTDSVHKEGTTIKDSIDFESVIFYLKHSFDNRHSQ